MDMAVASTSINPSVNGGGAGLSSPATVIRTGDRAFDEEANKNAERLLRQRRGTLLISSTAAAGETSHSGVDASDDSFQQRASEEVPSLPQPQGALLRQQSFQGNQLQPQLTRSKSRRAVAGEEDQTRPEVLVGNLIGEDHVNYVLMYNMLTGIRIGVSIRRKHGSNDS